MTILNSRIANMLYAYRIPLSNILLFVSITGCTTLPEKVQPVNIPIPVIVSCPSVAKPATVQPKDGTRVEWLRAVLVNREINQAYIKELEATLEACK